MISDLKYACRTLLKSPEFTLVAVITLALGIAANTAIFSVVDAVLLHPLPYPDSARLVNISQTVRSTGVSTQDVSPANFIDWATQNSVFAAVASGRGWQANLSGGEEPERVRAMMASSQFFTLFGVNPLVGRTFGPNDARQGNAEVVVLGEALWARRFGADPDVIGRDLFLDGQKFTVIGVMPAGFSPDNYGELWVPSPFDVPTHPLSPNDNPREMRDRSFLDAWARLKPGVSTVQAQAEMSAIALRLERQYPESDQDTGVVLVPMHEQLVGGVRPILLILSGAVALVLLIACANVANLLLARAATRSRELAIRTALGASRSRLMRQLLSESLLLALLGGAVGVLFALWALPLLLALSPSEIVALTSVGLNRQVLGFSLVVALLTAILFGLAPAFFAARSDPSASLREGARGSSLNTTCARSILIAIEIALSLVLLVGAGLMMKSFIKLTAVDPGFDPDRLLVFNLGLPASASHEQQTSFYQEVVKELTALPGIESVGAVSRLPLAGGNSSRSFNIPGSGQTYNADVRVSTPEYFRTMKIPLLKGRNFNDHDRADSPPVAIINQATAASVFPGQDPIGKYLTNFGPEDSKLQVVGVVGNVRHLALETAARPEIYVPVRQEQWPSMFVTLRSAVAKPLNLLPSVQDIVWRIDRNIPVANPRTMEDVLAHSLLRRKFAMLLLSIFAGLATSLAAIGLYGVISFSVAQRTKEIGIRMALGGQRGDVLRMVLRQSSVLVLSGLLLGVPVALAVARLLGWMLYGVGSADLLIYSSVVLLLALAALAASIVPALRATQVDPMVALRYE